MLNEKFRNLILDAFVLGKYVIVYGSILFLTILGVAVWVIGALNLLLIAPALAEEWYLYHNSKNIEINAIIFLNICLLSIVLFICAIGLHGIFVRRTTGIRLPFLLKITTVSELEVNLFGAIAAMLLVTALERIIQGSAVFTEIAMICAVIVAISTYVFVKRSRDRIEFNEE
ncbi:MAG: YqhA family protein [Theionarchaea archaeon]|nr:YqhA family protein [Theionarchaea archaeon]